MRRMTTIAQLAAIPEAERAALPPRERILQTAYALFYRDGIRATGIDRVIAESGVSKVTFYRQFPSKNDLILAFLTLRHERWMAWFSDALQRHGAKRPGLDALVATLGEWFASEDFRGCAFLNSVGELGHTLPEVLEVTRRHKADMARAIESLLPAGAGRKQIAAAAVLAADGAILHAQYEPGAQAALKQLTAIVHGLGA